MKKIQVRKNKENESSGGETPSTYDVGGVSPIDKEVSLSYFENELGGKRIVENGITKIVI